MVNESNTINSFDIETDGLEPIENIDSKGKITKECRVTTIGVYSSDGIRHLFFDIDEKSLLIKFFEFVNSHRNDVWTGYNIIEFDIPFLIFRGLKHDLIAKDDHIWRLKYGVHKWLNPFVVDTAPIFAKGWKNLRKLQSVLKHLNLETKTSDGLEAIRMWKEKKYGELNEYVLNDAYVEYQLYKWCEERGAIPKW